MQISTTNNGARLPQAAEREEARTLQDYSGELLSYGARPYLLSGYKTGLASTAGGVPLRISVAGLVQSTVPKDSLVMRLAMLLEQGVPVTLSLCNLGVGDEAIRNFEMFCECLSRRLPENERHSESIGLCIQSHQIPLQAYLVLSTSLLGNGPRYVNLDSLQMRDNGRPDVQRETDNNWSFLWRQAQSDLPLIPTYGSSVRAPCPLLSDESAGSVLPVLGVRVPADSAWLPIELRLTDFSDGYGNVNESDLREAATACVDIGERILDRLSWPLPRHDWDAVNNRRLAVHLSGLGDLVAERKSDPRDWRTLQRLDRIVGGVHATLWERSRTLARGGGVLPAIHLDDPSTSWTCPEHRNAWQSRWQSALQEHAVRHRNILAISPYSVLPRETSGAVDFTDLLPVLGHADAFAFADPPDLSSWNINEFSAFHRRAWAIIQAQNV